MTDYTGTSGVFYVSGASAKTGSKKEFNIIENSIVYPNPNQGEFVLETKENGSGFYEISDPLGRLIFKGITNKNKATTIKLNAEKGVYFLNVHTENGKNYTHKIVIE